MESPLEQAWEFFGGSPLHPHHGWQKTLCVLHSERRPSAQVNLELGKWRCFAGCGHGDVYDLIGEASKNGLIPGDPLTDFLDQKRFAEEHGWHAEESEPEPSLMNPKPRTVKRGTKKWKPSWV